MVGGNREADDGVVVGMFETGELGACEAGLAVNPLRLVDEFFAINRETESGDEGGIADGDAEVISGFDRGGVLIENNAVTDGRRHGEERIAEAATGTAGSRGIPE